MFSSSNKIKTINTAPPLDSNFGSEFIHTMQDDLNPTAAAQKKTITPQESVPARKNINPSPVLASTSPFLSQTESGPTAKMHSENAPSPINATLSDTKPFEGATNERNFSSNNTSPFPVQAAPKKSSVLWKMLTTLIVILIIGVLAAGAYYFFVVKNAPASKTSSPENEPIENSTPTPSEEQVLITPVSEKYSYEKPNYLPINIELSSSEEIQKIVSTTAEEISNIQTKVPFEFIVTDSNNTPIAFPIFSVASNLNLSSELLANLEESFSFFIHNEQGKTRTGIAIELKNKNNVLAEMLNQESTLTENLSFLFLSKPIINEKIVFKSGEYNGVKVRFFNLAANDDSTSIDYGIYDNKLIIATSKNAMWAIIDKIVAQKTQSQPGLQGTSDLNIKTLLENSPVQAPVLTENGSSQPQAVPPIAN